VSKSPHSTPQEAATVSLADEDGVKRILIDTLFGFAGSMWRGLVEWASAQMLRPGFELAGPQDMRISTCVEDANQAMAVIRAHHARWTAKQSQREL